MATAESNRVIEYKLAGTVLTFSVKGAGECALDLGKVSAEVREAAVVNGFKQRIADAAALSRDTTTGKSASPVEKLAAMKALCEHYGSGTKEWAVRRAGGAKDAAGPTALLFAALMGLEEYAEKGEERVRAFVVGLTKEQKDALLLVGKIKAAADGIQAKAVEGIDTEALLGGLI